MLLHRIKLVLRSLKRGGNHAALSVGGLTLAIACCLLTYFYIRAELEVNAVFHNEDRLYRVDSRWSNPTAGLPMTTLAPTGETLVRDFPEVERQARLYHMANTVRVDDESFRKSVIMADSTLFRMFDVPFVHGAGETSLDAPNSVVISESFAETLFGSADVLGRTVQIETWSTGWQDYTVTGVRADLPYNSLTNYAEWTYDLIIPPTPYGAFIGEDGWNSWHSRYIMQFVELANGASVSSLAPKLERFVETYAPAEYHGELEIWLNPLKTVYLTDFDGRGARTIWLLSGIALLVLLLACINFVNLATASSFGRLNEIGVRKALGAQRSELVRQFLSETLVTSAAASILAISLTAIAMPPLMELLGKQDVAVPLFDASALAAVIGITLLVAALAGTYPALVLSSFRPSRALKGLQSFRPSVLWLRRGLVMMQFAAAIVLAVAVYTISDQLSFITQKDLGFDRENVLVIESVPRQWNTDGLNRAQTARARLEDGLASVQSASLSWGTATDAGNTVLLRPTGTDEEAALSIAYHMVDGGFLSTFGLRLIAGRFHSDGGPNDGGIVINEKAAEAFGWTPDEALSQLLSIGSVGGEQNEEDAPRPVIGVVADHHFESLHEPIRPLAMFDVEDENMYRMLSLRLATTDLEAAITDVQTVWAEVFPAAPFEFFFMDDDLDRVYQSELQIRQLVSVGTGIALLIALLGVVGLASLSVTQRTREIGIRKALGASVTHILLLLTSDIVRMLVVGLIVAAPIAYYLMDAWLGGFAYRISVPWMAFAAAGAGTILAAWLAMAFHSLRASLIEPVESLRYE